GRHDRGRGRSRDRSVHTACRSPMRTVHVNLGPASHSAFVGTGLLDRLGELARDVGLKPGSCAIVTDSNVEALYSLLARESLESSGFAPTVISITPGEASKSPATLQTLYDRMAVAKLDRSSVVFAVGGGVVGDLAGFAAATFLRGVPLVQVPTSVVA